ncbi:MAG: hypothetical protein JSU65_00195 [Candidatus Zixiibacteriota bacterium]|nr:MAG: hypothetical protein JSU65_00195 [candidate division Zixibacteria bacterium]
MIATAVVVSLTQAYDAWSFHTRQALLDWLAPVTLFIIILVIRETAMKLGIYDRLAKSLKRVLILLGLVMTTSFLFLFLSPLLDPVLRRLYQGNETLLAIALAIGSLPFVILSLISAILVIVVVVKVLRAPMPRILPTRLNPPAA